MLKGMMDGSGRASAHISATMLTATCPRQLRLLQDEEWYENPETGFPKFRGTMGHAMVERYPQPGCIYEQRFEAPLTLSNGSVVKITGQLDKLDPVYGHIEDGKTKDDAKINRLKEPEDAHIWQLNIYRWLVYYGSPQIAITQDSFGTPLATALVPGTPSQITVRSLRLVYWSMKKPVMLVPPLIDLDDIEEFIRARADTISNPTLPAIPDELDPLKSKLCLDWCPVRSACLVHEVGF
jgi:hypothetical protein